MLERSRPPHHQPIDVPHRRSGRVHFACVYSERMSCLLVTRHELPVPMRFIEGNVESLQVVRSRRYGTGDHQTHWRSSARHRIAPHICAVWDPPEVALHQQEIAVEKCLLRIAMPMSVRVHVQPPNVVMVSDDSHRRGESVAPRVELHARRRDCERHIDPHFGPLPSAVCSTGPRLIIGR